MHRPSNPILRYVGAGLLLLLELPLLAPMAAGAVMTRALAALADCAGGLRRLASRPQRPMGVGLPARVAEQR